MTVDVAKFVTPDRKTVQAAYLRSFKFRVSDADIGSGTQPYVDAQVCSDTVAPIHAEAKIIAKATDVLDAVGQSLDDWGNRIGRERKDATQAQGFVVAQAASGGALVAAGTQGRYLPKGSLYNVAVTAVYNDGDLIPVQSVDVGLTVNLAAGSTITWVSPPTGLKSTANVFANTDGTGLTGGAPAEDDDTYRAALLDRMRNPVASGNSAHYAAVVEEIPGLGVQKCFVYPCWNGPGTVAVAFTMRPSEPGASRIPNGAQLTQAEAVLKDAFPADDGISMCSVVEDAIDLAIGVTWRGSANGWTDLTPWPIYYADPVHVTGTPTNGTARITSSSTITAPQVGQSIGLLDQTTQTYKRKRISGVTQIVANTTYDLTFDVTTAASSDTYIPISGQMVSPWSPSLNSVVTPILEYLDRQGPGEMFASLPDPGQRQRRFPTPDPETYPSRLENRIVDGLFAVCADAEVLAPNVPVETTVGTPGVEVEIHALADLGVYPQ